MLTTTALLTGLSLFQPLTDEFTEWTRVQSSWGHTTRVELETDGGPLPFIIQMPIHSGELNDSGYAWGMRQCRIVNGEELIEHELWCDASTARQRSTGELRFEQYDSVLKGTGDKGPIAKWAPVKLMRAGVWEKRRGDQVVSVGYTMTEVDSPGDRFDVIEEAGEAGAFGGHWSVDFGSSDEQAIGTFSVDANQIASGTFLTTTGDYRYLAGRVDGNLMRLSTFDGAHAFLFHARLQDDGSIVGDFWSGNWHHETWSAVRDDDAQLPDAFEQTTVTDSEAIEELVFKDLDGTPTRVLDVLDRSGAKARIIEIFGSWCPNCSDAGRELVSLKESFGDDLAIVGLAFEITEDFERSVEQVKRHHEHIGSDWPILIGGLYNKDKATETLGFLDRVRSYPTLVFLDEQNQVQAVHSGFSGPATGEAYTKQRARFEELIRSAIESDL